MSTGRNDEPWVLAKNLVATCIPSGTEITEPWWASEPGTRTAAQPSQRSDRQNAADGQSRRGLLLSLRPGNPTPPAPTASSIALGYRFDVTTLSFTADNLDLVEIPSATDLGRSIKCSRKRPIGWWCMPPNSLPAITLISGAVTTTGAIRSTNSSAWSTSP